MNPTQNGHAGLEAYFDEVPRSSARAELFGPFTLFVSHGPWAYYLRPALGANVTVADAGDLRRALARCDELEIPRQVEWQEQISPDLAGLCVAEGLVVRRHPLLVHSRSGQHDSKGVKGFVIEHVDAADNSLGRILKVNDVAWRHVDVVLSSVGVAERDDTPESPEVVDLTASRIRNGDSVFVVCRNEDVGPVGLGAHHPRNSVTEITSIGVLPAFRCMGIASALTTLLTVDAYDRGCETVFLSAQNETVARIYERLGFQQVGVACVAEPPPEPGPSDRVAAVPA